MSSLPNPQPRQPPPRQPLGIQRRPSTRRNRDANPPKPPSRSSSFSFNNRTSFSSIDSAIHNHLDSTPKSQSRSNNGGNGIHNPSVPITATTTAATSSQPSEQQQSFTCTFCWRPYPSSDRNIFHRTTYNGRGSWKIVPRPACPHCYRAIIDLSIYWVCGEVVLRGEECVSLGWCFWHKACYGCLLCGSKRVVRPPEVAVGEVLGNGDAKVENNDEMGRRGMLGRKRGREIDQVPLCKGCLVEVEGEEGLGDGDKDEREKVVVKKGLERIDRVDGGLTRQRWEMREGDKEKERKIEKDRTMNGGKGGLSSLRRGAVDDRSLNRDETIYVNIFDPVGREAFRPGLMKSIPDWMQTGAQELLDHKSGTINSRHDKSRETISTPRPISQGLSESSSTATVIQTPPQPTATHALTRRQSGAISPRATSPAQSNEAISRPSSVLGRRTPNLRTGTSFVSEQPLIVPSMSSSLPKETTNNSAENSARDSWPSTDSNLSSNPITSSNNQSEILSHPSSVRNVATIFERDIASKDQRHTPTNQALPLLRVLQQPYRPLSPTSSDTSFSSSPHLKPNDLAKRQQRAQTHELGAASLPKPIQIWRGGQGGQKSQINRLGSATVSIPVVSTSSEYLERYQPVKASATFLSSSSPAQVTRSSVRSIRVGGPGVRAITRGWEGQPNNTTSSGETERDLLANRVSVYSTSQPPSSLLQSSSHSGERTSIRRSVSHSIRREGALDEGMGVGAEVGKFSYSAEPYSAANGQVAIRRLISHSLRREGAHDHKQNHRFTSHSQSAQSPTLPPRNLPYSSPRNSSRNSSPKGPTSPIPLNITIQRKLTRNNSKGEPTIGKPVVTAASTSAKEQKGATSSSESFPGVGTLEGKGGGGGSTGLRGSDWTQPRTPSTGRVVTEDTSWASGAGISAKRLPKRKSVHAELKRLFGRQ